MMTLLNEERKQMITKLQAIKDELGLIDFLREYFLHDEFADVFDMETEERIKIAKAKFSYNYYITENYDIRKYTFFCLHTFVPKKYKINCFYVEVNILKVIIFYEHIVKPVENKEENVDKNKKIKESTEVYNFYKALISDEKCQISNYTEAIKILGFEKLTQSDLDDDKNRIMRDFLSRLIQENYFPKAIEEYKNYL